ncbi:MAG TPA: hypothetical protein VFE45_05810 [Coriobacteriia bacterium]|nr:hypothetical protein [Coriobacteriia bacterium]
MTTDGRDPCLSHTFPEALCCGDCHTINRTWLAAFIPHVRPDREVYTVADIDGWLERNGGPS